MTDERIIVYRKRVKPSSDGRNLEVWTVFIDQAGMLREFSGHVRDTEMVDGFTFQGRRAHPDRGKKHGDDLIMRKRLFEGYSIHPQPCLLNCETKEVRPDPDASRLKELEGEDLPLDPALNPNARALGSPDWFF